MTEAEILFTEVLDCDKMDLFLNKEYFLAKDQSTRITKALKRRINSEPMQYILGRLEFFGLEFEVDRNVFIPRQETEILVETAIKIVQRTAYSVRRILDLGTGSGCIAISLAKFLKGAKIFATDISHKALEVARVNALLNNAEVSFLQSDLFSNYELRTKNYELIISNPPYIPTHEIDTLQPEIKYEPRIALNGGQDGLDFYRRIIAQSPSYLNECGFLILEMGFNQREVVENILQQSGNFKIVEVVKDYSGIDRVIIGKKITKFQETITKQ